MKKFIKNSLIILGVTAVLFVVYLAWVQYKINKGDLIMVDNEWYTKEQIQNLVGPQYYEVEAKNTPEEVYAEFRQALLDGDNERALGLIREEKREGYRDAFGNQEKLDDWLVKLPNTINQESLLGNHAAYYYLNAIDKSDKVAHPISFRKNRDGYWEIDQI